MGTPAPKINHIVPLNALHAVKADDLIDWPFTSEIVSLTPSFVFVEDRLIWESFLSLTMARHSISIVCLDHQFSWSLPKFRISLFRHWMRIVSLSLLVAVCELQGIRWALVHGPVSCDRSIRCHLTAFEFVLSLFFAHVGFYYSVLWDSAQYRTTYIQGWWLWN